MKKSTAAILACVIVVVLAALTFVSLHGMPIGIYDVNPLPGIVETGMDTQQGYYVIYRQKESEKKLTSEQIDASLAIFQQRLKDAGYDNATAVKYGDDQIAVRFPINQFSAYTLQYLGYVGDITLEDSNEKVIVERKNIVHAEYATSVSTQAIFLKFDGEGTSKFASASSAAALNNKAITLLIDGEEIAAPTLSDTVTGGEFGVTGVSGADMIAATVKSAMLPAAFTIDRSYTVSGTAGSGAIDAGLIASIVAVALIVVFMVIRYRALAAAGLAGLWLYALLTLLTLALLPGIVALSLQSVAAIVIVTALAVMTHIIIFEQIRSEYLSGKPMKSSIKSGFSHGLIASRYINYAMFILAMVAFPFGYQQFSIMMMMGILIMMLSVTTLTRAGFRLMRSFNVKAGCIGIGKKEGGAEK